jgi:hypothetical protein
VNRGKKRIPGGDYMLKNRNKLVHKCDCSECIEQPQGEIALYHGRINDLLVTLDEKDRRQFGGLLASQLGHGGIQYIAKITGFNRQTISRGKQEIEQANRASDRAIRVSGAGRPKAEKKSQAC